MPGKCHSEVLETRAGVSTHLLGTRDWWDEYFSVGGGWETRGGRIQTKTFAKAFLCRIKLDKESSFRLLDVGCALGDATALFRKHYPKAKLFAIDISETAIRRCREEFGSAATFQVKTIEDIYCFYDVIYCSNVLEHFSDYKRKTRHLVTNCARLFVVVPFRESRHGKLLQNDPNEHHQHTFDFDSFDFLIEEGLATAIHSHVFTCPGAWSWPKRRWLMEMLIKNPLRLVLRKSLLRNPLVILYDISTAGFPSVLH